jgi:catechol 2,3-dioxygenase-like lactoylglutathione lyase family enzyme
MRFRATAEPDHPGRERPDAIAGVLPGCPGPVAQVRDAGARVVKPAGDAPWGGRSGYFADPDGFLWEVAWNPGFRIHEDGSIEVPA